MAEMIGSDDPPAASSSRRPASPSADDGRPFRVAFTLGVVSAVLNRMVGSPWNDFAVFLVVTSVSLAMFAWWASTQHRQLLIAALAGERLEQRAGPYCSCCGQRLPDGGRGHG